MWIYPSYLNKTAPGVTSTEGGYRGNKLSTACCPPIIQQTGGKINGKAQKPKYEYVERLKLYRKRIKDSDGKYVAIYGKTPEELTEKLRAATATIEEGQIQKENPLVKDYAADWL